MIKKLPVLLLLVGSLPFITFAQQLSLSTSARTCSAGEQVWVNLSIQNAASMPGAYKITIGFDEAVLSYLNTLPADHGPFAITPATSAGNGSVTIAGFQGIVDTGNGSTSLVTLLFVTTGDKVTIDSTTFSVTGNEIFSTQAQRMYLTVSRIATAVQLPPSKKTLHQGIHLTGNYLKFSIPRAGITSVRIYNLNGKTVATPLAPSHLSAGNHGVSIGSRLSSGIYLVSLRGNGICTTKRVEVLR